MNGLFFALGSAFFEGLMAIFGKVGVQSIDSNLGAENANPQGRGVARV
jgi:uncharacterized membrane protein